MADSETANTPSIRTVPCCRKATFTIALLVLALFSEQAHGDHLPAWAYLDHARTRQSWESSSDDDEAPDTRSGHARYLTPDELEVLAEINLMRSDPASYAALRLEPLRSQYQGKRFFPSGSSVRPVWTREGVKALDECIRVLKNTKPMPRFSPSEALTLAAREMTQDQGATTQTGHVGCSGSTMLERILRHGNWRSTLAENISYGYHNPGEIVVTLLIDDGVYDRAHRLNLLNIKLNRIGISIWAHRRYNVMCVMDFAAGYNANRL